MRDKDVPDELALSLSAGVEDHHGCRWPYFARHPAFPRKVILAKLRSLQQRHLLRGCAWPGSCVHGRPEPKIAALAKCSKCPARVAVMDENDVVTEEVEHALAGCNGSLFVESGS